MNHFALDALKANDMCVLPLALRTEEDVERSYTAAADPSGLGLGKHCF